MSKSKELSPTKLTEHISSLDGLRGLAILMVMMLHFYNEAIINNGYPIIGPIITKIALSGLYGNQLFFVISGFLITKILLDSKGQSHFFRNFYIRRFLRIIPLYYAVLFLIFFILPLFVTFDAAAKDIASRQIWLWTFLTNYSWSGGRWDSSNIFRLGHFWFVCMLVHYYIVWPFIVYKLQTRALINACISLIIIFLFIRIIHTLTGGNPLFPWPVNGLLWGSLLAAGLKSETISIFFKKYASWMIWIAGFIFLMLIFVPRRIITGYYWTATDMISVILFSGLLIIVIKKAGSLQKLVTQRIFISLGKYSYGIYLIHNVCLPFFQWLFKPTELSIKLGTPLLAQVIFYVLSISVSFLLAFAIWHLYEKHFIKLKELFDYQSQHELKSA